jgi:hypothetical protein
MNNRREFLLASGAAAVTAVTTGRLVAEEPFHPLPLQVRSNAVSPWTGIVLWDTNERAATDAIQLEYSYMKYSDVVRGRDEYDWDAVERKLERIAGRQHQAIFRFHDTYPGQPTTVPDYIRELPDYQETQGRSEGKETGFPDWSHPEWQRCVLAMFEAFAQRYDRDPRLAYLQCGFGLWAEYHLYDGPFELGKTFPSKEYQADFLRQKAGWYQETPWMISVDAADRRVTPIVESDELRALPFGVFDDSFLCEQHARVNERNWRALGSDRWRRAPAGGEFSYYTQHDQREALAENGPHGESYEQAAARFHVSFIIGSGQPRYRPMERIRQAGVASGYRLAIVGYETNGRATRVTVENIGVAPPYHDAYVTLGDMRAEETLKGLLPGETRICLVARPPGDELPIILSPRLVPGQTIPYTANL